MPDRPNVVFVFADQMRAEALGCLGNDDVQTPNLDGMAAGGACFTRAYANTPVCSPARGCIMTGNHAHEHGVIANTYYGLRLPRTGDTAGHRFADAGYQTGYIGKWHLDGGDDVPGHVPPERRHGFEFWEGFNRGHQHFNGHPRYEDGDFRREGGYEPDVQTDIAVEFIEDRAGDDTPFCLFTSWGPPHGLTESEESYRAPEEHADLYDAAELSVRPNVSEERTEAVRSDLVEYYGQVTALDENVGRILSALEACGVAEETIVVFTSDHGDMLGSHDSWGKGIPLEESVHVPLLLHYPAGVDGGRTVEAPVGLVDLLPTLCSLCDLPVPDVHGDDVSGALAGGTDPERGVYLEGKLPFDDTWRALRTERYLVSVDRHLETRYLFDMDADLYQQENLAGRRPELEAELRERLFERAAAVDDRHVIARKGAADLGNL